jgi:acyl-CoA synthetase (AMP-forming)/AMP-acid ligase II
VVLPSYGMTECMPISSPPLDYQLDREGTSGKAVGPELSIRSLPDGQPLQTGLTGAICVRGPPMFGGYGNPNETAEAMLPGGWFNTGDMGHVDKDGYLYITGRSKEVINRGGELISPVEVENALQSHPFVGSCCAINVPHDTLQEVVGIVVATKAGMPRPGLVQLQEHVAATLHPSKWPMAIVYMDNGLPLTSTNKVTR